MGGVVGDLPLSLECPVRRQPASHHEVGEIQSASTCSMRSNGVWIIVMSEESPKWAFRIFQIRTVRNHRQGAQRRIANGRYVCGRRRRWQSLLREIRGISVND